MWSTLDKDKDKFSYASGLSPQVDEIMFDNWEVRWRLKNYRIKWESLASAGGLTRSKFFMSVYQVWELVSHNLFQFIIPNTKMVIFVRTKTAVLKCKISHDFLSVMCNLYFLVFVFVWYLRSVPVQRWSEVVWVWPLLMPNLLTPSKHRIQHHQLQQYQHHQVHYHYTHNCMRLYNSHHVLRLAAEKMIFDIRQSVIFSFWTVKRPRPPACLMLLSWIWLNILPVSI